jgi:hypothetical protein
MKLHYGVELLLVHLDGEREPYCSLRYLETALNRGNLQELMEKLGLRMKTTTLRCAGLLPDIVKLRSGISEPEPVLVEFRTADCLIKHLALGPPEFEDVSMKSTVSSS